MRKTYNISECSKKETELLKDLIRKALFGYIRMKADETIDEFVSQIKTRNFSSDDKFILNFTIETIGNDILTAVGVIKNQLENKE